MLEYIHLSVDPHLVVGCCPHTCSRPSVGLSCVMKTRSTRPGAALWSYQPPRGFDMGDGTRVASPVSRPVSGKSSPFPFASYHHLKPCSVLTPILSGSDSSWSSPNENINSLVNSPQQGARQSQRGNNELYLADFSSPSEDTNPQLVYENIFQMSSGDYTPDPSVTSSMSKYPCQGSEHDWNCSENNQLHGSSNQDYSNCDNHSIRSSLSSSSTQYDTDSRNWEQPTVYVERPKRGLPNLEKGSKPPLRQRKYQSKSLDSNSTPVHILHQHLGGVNQRPSSSPLESSYTQCSPGTPAVIYAQRRPSMMNYKKDGQNYIFERKGNTMSYTLKPAPSGWRKWVLFRVDLCISDVVLSLLGCPSDCNIKYKYRSGQGPQLFQIPAREPFFHGLILNILYCLAMVVIFQMTWLWAHDLEAKPRTLAEKR